MLFTSAAFALFFPLTALGWFLIPARGRRPFLLVMSIAFYMAAIPAYILVLFSAVLIDWSAAVCMEGAPRGKQKVLLFISITFTCGLLFSFKYQAFFLENFLAVTKLLGLNLQLHPMGWPLPIGLSFHTFQSLAYVIEVYQGRQKPERNLLTYSLYVLFWPQLAAGPIERPQHLLPQLKILPNFDRAAASHGLRLMALGFFKKFVVADQLAAWVNPVYAHPKDFGGLSLCLATLAFSIQIYGDFSGYTDIARGAAHVMGFRLVLNFNRPYLSTNLRAFWNRWHMSLYSWFRDYVYIPLGGNRHGSLITIRNLLIAFLLSGLWHGAAWTFVVWGGLNGLGLLIHLVWCRTGLRMPRVVGWALTSIFLGLTWVFFRASSFTEAFFILKSGFHACARCFSLGGISHEFTTLIADLNRQPDGPALLLAPAIGVTLLAVYEFFQDRVHSELWLMTRPLPIRLGFYAAGILLILGLGNFGNNPFIYFQF